MTVRCRALLWVSLLLFTAVYPVFSQKPQPADASAPQTPAKPETQTTLSEYDQLLNDIDNDKDAETRLERYWVLAGNKKVPASIQKSALEKWHQIFAKKIDAAAVLENGKLAEVQSPQDWDGSEKLFQKALALFPAPAMRTEYGNFLLRRAADEIKKGNISSGAALIGRAQELGADENSLKGLREQLTKQEAKWGGSLWTGIKARSAAIWSGVTAILGSPHVWALLGIFFAVWLYRKLRGNRKDYQFEPFIVVQQRDADGKDKIYPGLTARLLKEMKRVAEIHQGSSQKALDEISDPLGNSVPINFTEYEPELTSKIEQIPEISVGAVKLPVISYLAILLRVNVKRVRTYYEEFSIGQKTYLRLIADMRGTRALALEAEYAEPKPVTTRTAEQIAMQQFLEHAFPGVIAAEPPPPVNEPELPSKEEVLESLITQLACEIRFTRIVEENLGKAKKPEESYSRSAEVYREFTLGLDAQHNAAQILSGASPTPQQAAQARLEIETAYQHYSRVIAVQSDHAAAYFCRAGISLQRAQLDKALATYQPDTPSDPAQFDRPTARTKIDDAIADYRVATRLGRPHLRGLSYFNLGNIFYRIHRCDAYEQALEYADQAETAFELALNYIRDEATELCRRVWLLKVAILVDQAGSCELSHKRGSPGREIQELLSNYKREDPHPGVSEYWRIKAKAQMMEARECFKTFAQQGWWDDNTKSLLSHLLRDAEKKAKWAVELDPDAAENYNTCANVGFVRLKKMKMSGEEGTAGYQQHLQETLAAYDRACELSTHEFYFYNRAIARDEFASTQIESIKRDYVRACATIANGQRSTRALLDYGDFLEKQGETQLAEKFRALAGRDSRFKEAQQQAPDERQQEPVAE